MTSRKFGNAGTPYASLPFNRSDMPLTEYHLRRHMWLQYGITLEQYEAMEVAQDHKCAICMHNDPARKNGRWDIDHDHDTGRVRGLLCHHCNILIGAASDNPTILYLAAEYLEKHGREIGG